MKTVPKDDKTLDARFKTISGEKSLAAHIANASLPNAADPHQSSEIITRFAENSKSYVGSVVRAGRRFRASETGK